MTSLSRRRFPLLLAFAVPMLAALSTQAQENSQPADEAAAQKWLPKAHDPLWTKLAACKVSYNRKGLYSIDVTPEVKALNGQDVSVRGFILPMDGSDRTKHFLITRNTPVCMFCPPGEPNEVIEVFSDKAIPWNEQLKTVSGRLRLIDDKEQALFFRIEAKAVKS